jgi:hypothetical protein
MALQAIGEDQYVPAVRYGAGPFPLHEEDRHTLRHDRNQQVRRNLNVTPGTTV